MISGHVVTGMDMAQYTFSWLIMCFSCYICGKIRGRIETMKEVEKHGMEIKKPKALQ